MTLLNTSHKSFESPYESKGKGPVMSYEKFVQLLDPEDPVAQKAISILVNDVFSRARGKKQAIDETRQLHHPTYSSIVATSGAAGGGGGGTLFSGSTSRSRLAVPSGGRNHISSDNAGVNNNDNQSGGDVHWQRPSLSQRLHGWRVPADYSDLNQYTNQQRQDETAEYDAIIADAQRQVASPLPMAGQTAAPQGQGQALSREQDAARLFNSIDWPDLNPGVGAAYDHLFYTSDSDDSEDESTAQLRRVERELAVVATARNRTQSNLTRTSTSDSLSSAATRRRILQRLEQRRRDVAESSEQPRTQLPSSQSQSQTEDQPRSMSHRYPSYFNTSYSRAAPNRNTNESSRPIPVIVGGDFSELPTAVSRSEGDTVRASYGSLHRSNSIRRSGFHAAREQQLQQNSPPTIAVSDTLLPRTSESPLRSSPGRLQPRSPLSISEPSENSSLARLTAGVINANNMFTRPGATSLDTGTSRQRQDAFLDFARLNRQADRASREGSGREQQGNEEDLPRAESALNRFLFSASTDPMLGAAAPSEEDGLSELLGSSSTVAGLGSLATEDRLSRSPLSMTEDDRRNLVPPRAPILSRRSFPFDMPQTTASQIGGSTGPARPIPVRQQTTSSAQNTSSQPAPQRANSFPDGRGPLYRREEILSLAQFLNEDSIRAVEGSL